MKRVSCALIVFLLAIASYAQTNERFHIVEVTEPTSDKFTQIASAAAYQSLKTEMKTKNQLLSKALDLTNKEWREKHSELGSFPRRIASPGEIKSISQFTNKADAEKELKSLLAQDEQEEEEENLSSAEKQLLLWRDQLNALLSIGSRTTEQQNHVANLQTSITTLEQHLAKKQAKNDARDEKLAVAREIFKTKLHQLLVGKQKAKANDKKM